MPRRGQPNNLVVDGVFQGDLEDQGHANKMQTYLVSVNELERIVRASRGRTLMVSVRQDLVHIDQSRAEPGKILTVRAYGHVKVSRDEALKFIKSAYAERIRPLVHAEVSICSSCLFIG